MLVGKQGKYEKPEHPCLVPGCQDKSFTEGGACRKHLMDKIDWLRRRVMSRVSPWVVVLDKGKDH